MRKTKKAFIVVALALFLFTVFILLWAVILKVLGFEINKSYFTYSREACIENVVWDDIEGCIFWSRNDYLKNKERWASQFVKDDKYCDEALRQYKVSGKRDVFTEYDMSVDDPKCRYSSFEHQKRLENWEYLTSDKKDNAYYSCLERLCPEEHLFK